jgi:hypothetical protein
MTHVGLKLTAWVLALALLLPWQASSTGAGRSAAARLLGPVASLGASVLWIRFDLALRNGQPERAYALATDALRLDPRAVIGWSTLARHLIFDRASLENEADPARRRRWIRSGLDVLERGSGKVRDPGELAFTAALALNYVALIAGELEWPGGPAAALDEAIAQLERALSAGHPYAREHLALTRAERARLVD